MKCPDCKRDIRKAFSRKLDSCQTCGAQGIVNPWTCTGPGFINRCVTELERAAGPVYRFLAPYRRWSVADMTPGEFYKWCRAELRKAERPDARLKRPATAAKVQAFDPGAFDLVSA